MNEEVFMHAHSIKVSLLQKKQVLTKAFIRMTDLLQLTRRETALIIGVSESSLSRLYDGKRLMDPASKEGELATLLIRLYRSLDILFGGNTPQCQLWLRSPNHHLKTTPIQLLQSIQGLMTTLSYLDAMRGKN